jgi:moderate conductance mechanosensitive channel
MPELNLDAVLQSLGRIVLVIVLAALMLAGVDRAIARAKMRMLQGSDGRNEPPSESAKRVDTLMRLLHQGGRLIVLLLAVLILLSTVGVPIGPLLAGAGVFGLAIGFGAQALVRDFIAGFFIILENQVRIGDVAIVNGTGGLVEAINLRTLVLRDLSGVVHVFPNGTINTLSNMTHEWSAYVFDIGVAYKENTDAVIQIIREVGEQLQADAGFAHSILEPLEIFGVDKLADSAVIIKGRIKTRPIRQWVVGREFLRRIKLAFDEKGIEIPFPHRTLYAGDASKPFDLRMLSGEPSALPGNGGKHPAR